MKSFLDYLPDDNNCQSGIYESSFNLWIDNAFVDLSLTLIDWTQYQPKLGILQILDLITFSILRSWFNSILDFYVSVFKAHVAMPFLD